MKEDREILIVFADENVKEAFERTKERSPELYKFISRAIDDLKNNPLCGVHIPKRLIPKVYIQKYGIDNL